MIRDSTKIYAEVNNPNTVKTTSALNNDCLIIKLESSTGRNIDKYQVQENSVGQTLLLTNDSGNLQESFYNTANKFLMTDVNGNLVWKG